MGVGCWAMWQLIGNASERWVTSGTDTGMTIYYTYFNAIIDVEQYLWSSYLSLSP